MNWGIGSLDAFLVLNLGSPGRERPSANSPCGRRTVIGPVRFYNFKMLNLLCISGNHIYIFLAALGPIILHITQDAKHPITDTDPPHSPQTRYTVSQPNGVLYSPSPPTDSQQIRPDTPDNPTDAETGGYNGKKGQCEQGVHNYLLG